jgi:hypothetical protein
MEVELVVKTEPPELLLGDVNAKKLIDQVCRPEVARFESWFQKNGHGGLLGSERELITAFLFQKLNGAF